MTLKFALLGHPVRHSLSPVLHGAAFSFSGLDAVYETIDTKEDELAARLETLSQQGYAGCNITIPHKKKVLPYLSALSPQARQVNAVNTICWHSDGAAIGHNTDLNGFRLALESFLAEVSRPPSLVLLLGSGGSALACVNVLDDIWAGPILVAARNQTVAQQMIGEKKSVALLAPEAKLIVQAVNKEPCLIVNTIPIGLTTTMPDWLEETFFGLPASSLLFDLVYTADRRQSTVLCNKAGKYGIKAVDGLAMLIEQARAAFLLWTGIAVPFHVMSKAVQ